MFQRFLFTFLSLTVLAVVMIFESVIGFPIATFLIMLVLLGKLSFHTRLLSIIIFTVVMSSLYDTSLLIPFILLSLSVVFLEVLRFTKPLYVLLIISSVASLIFVIFANILFQVESVLYFCLVVMVAYGTLGRGSSRGSSQKILHTK